MKGIDKLTAKGRHLRSLSLMKLNLMELLDSIGELIHLRYRDVSRNSIVWLPGGLTKLYNLQILRIDFNKYLYGVTVLVPKFPKGFFNLVGLRHLSVVFSGEMGIPENLGLMSELQKIPNIDVSKGWGGSISELRSLNNFSGELSLQGLEKMGIDRAKKENLGSEKIKSLKLSWRKFEDETQLADSIMLQQLEALQPSSNLRTLKLYCCCCRLLPKWLREMKGFGDSSMNKLTSLQINRHDFIELFSPLHLVALETLVIDSGKNMMSLSNLEPLCNLKYFRISSCPINQLPLMKNMVSLKELSLYYCKHLTSLSHLDSLSNLVKLWTEGCLVQQFPSLKNLVALKSLHVYQCKNLKTIPGLKYLTSLESMHIIGCLEIGNLGNVPASNHLSSLCLENCTSMTSLPSGISSLPNLHNMTLGPFNLELGNFPVPIVRDVLSTYSSLSKL